MKLKLVAVFASLMLLLGSVPQVRSQSASATFTNPYYRVCVNVNPATKSFNCQFFFNQDGLHKLYVNQSWLVAFLPDRRLSQDSDAASPYTVTQTANADGSYHESVVFSQYDEIINATQERLADAASGTVSFDLVPGAPGCTQTCWHTANVSASMTY